MGFDVYGRKPTAPEGEYFRNNVWWWRPLADLCQEFAPDVCDHCKRWHSNDGDGLGKRHALKLAAILEQRISDGTLERYITQRAQDIAAMPDEPCKLCKATGVRTDKISVEAGLHQKVITEPADHPRLGQTGWCNGCDGRGYRRPFATYYPCDIENVTEFVAFLKACGGFNIH